MDRQAIIDALQAGDLACFPTETLWSLSCRADDPAAVERLRSTKQRPATVALAVGFASWDEARQHVETTPGAKALAAAFLPGPLSLVLQRAGADWAHVAPGLDSISIRIPDHADARAILQATGPLVMTSANPHGGPDPKSCAEVTAALPDVAVLDGADVPGTASTVVDARGERPIILREGIISATEVAAAWP